jgi:hypothetical protein
MNPTSIKDFNYMIIISGSVVLEKILRSPCKKSPILGQLGLQEIILVAAWYIWWQRREAVKGEKVAPAARSAFSIQALTLNYGLAAENTLPKQVRGVNHLSTSTKPTLMQHFIPAGWVQWRC